MISAGNDLNAAGTAIDELRAELEAARTRIAELEQMWAEDTRRNGAEKTALEDALEKALLRAQGLSQEDREACEYGAYCIEKHTGLSEHLQAAILRRLGGQTT